MYPKLCHVSRVNLVDDISGVSGIYPSSFTNICFWTKIEFLNFIKCRWGFRRLSFFCCLWDFKITWVNPWVYFKISHPLGTSPLLQFVPSTTNLSHFNYLMNCLLCLRNDLLSVMMQQSCSNAFPLVGEELAHMTYNLHKIWKMSLCNKFIYHFV